MSRNIILVIIATLLVVFLTGWFYLTNLNIEDIEDKEIEATPTATPSATITPRQIIREVRIQSTSAPVAPTTVSQPNNTTVINNPPAPEPTTVQSTTAPEPTAVQQPTPTPKRCIINLLGIEVCL